MKNTKLTSTRLLAMIVKATKNDDTEKLESLIQLAENMLDVPSRRPRKRDAVFTYHISAKVEQSTHEWYENKAKQTGVKKSHWIRVALVEYQKRGNKS